MRRFRPFEPSAEASNLRPEPQAQPPAPNPGSNPNPSPKSKSHPPAPNPNPIPNPSPKHLTRNVKPKPSPKPKQANNIDLADFGLFFVNVDRPRSTLKADAYIYTYTIMQRGRGAAG